MIDFDKLRLTTSYENALFGVKKIVTTIPCRKPKSTEFFRIRPDPWTFDAFLLNLNDGEEEKYLVNPEFQEELLQLGLLKPVRIYTGIIYGTGVLFLTEVVLPDVDGKQNAYHRSRMEHYERGKKEWIKIVANKDLGAYEVYKPQSDLPEPLWPQEPEDIFKALEICFRDKVIDKDDHPVLNRIRGKL